MQQWAAGTLAALTLGVAVPVSAQSVTVIDCGPRVGLTVGAASNSDYNGIYDTYPNYRAGRTPDVSGTFELPLADRWSTRAEIGSAAWTFQVRDLRGEAIMRDRVRVTRATLSLVKQSPTPCGAPVRVYGGFGYGAYRYGFREQRVAVWRGGAHVVGGLEAMAREHVAVAADLLLHAIGGPRQDPVNSSVLLVLQFNVGVRVLF